MYEQAIKRAKAMIEVANNQEEIYNSVITIFPELKESYDEMIRKAIIGYLKSLRGKHALFPYEWIAWLEKQGDKKDNLSIDFVLGYLGIKPAYKDGNAWCILLGDNIQVYRKICKTILRETKRIG